jgi:hypothetical protein
MARLCGDAGGVGRFYSFGVTEDGWSFAGAREAARFALAMGLDGLGDEHAYHDRGTLCGIDERQVDVYRTHFRPDGARACPECRRLCAEAPTEPSGQERLHRLVSAAERGHLRDELLSALQRGADIRLWINGPSADMAKFYARPDELVDGRDAVAAALDGSGRAGVARVRHDFWEYVVALPEGSRPVVGRTTADGG